MAPILMSGGDIKKSPSPDNAVQLPTPSDAKSALLNMLTMKMKMTPALSSFNTTSPTPGSSSLNHPTPGNNSTNSSSRSSFASSEESQSPSSSPLPASCSPHETKQPGLTQSVSLSAALRELPDHVGQTMKDMPTSKPCTVCGEATKGIYYGAVTCLPCKTFFVRYSGETRNMKCRTGKRDCEINEATRVSCKACRFAKCIRAGMKKKERPEKHLPIKGEPVCAVCGDAANGLHFGVFTCEGCKKFFRRGLDEHTTYKCKHNIQCRMNPLTRSLCRLCRFQRCIEVGMSIEGIRFGRRKKHSDTGLQSNESEYTDEKRRNSSSSSESDLMDLSTPHPLPLAEGPITSSSPLDLSPSNYSPMISLESCSDISSLGASPIVCDQQPHRPNPFRPTPLEVSVPEQQPFQPAYPQSRESFNSHERSFHDTPQNAPVSPPKQEGLQQGFPCLDIHITSLDNRPKPEVIQYWQRSVPLEVSSITLEQRHLLSDLISLNEPQKMCIMRNPGSNNVTSLPGLVTAGNGSVDDGVIQNITNFVIFAKSLPGFDRIDRKDQYNLIRTGSTESRILSSAVYDTRSLDDQLQEAYMQKNPVYFKFLKTTFSISKAVRLLNLDEIESCLLFVLSLIATDRPDLCDITTIENLRQQYIAVLASYIEDNHGDAFSRLSAIFSVMPRVRQMGRWYCELIHNIPMDGPKDQPQPGPY